MKHYTTRSLKENIKLEKLCRVITAEVIVLRSAEMECAVQYGVHFTVQCDIPGAARSGAGSPPASAPARACQPGPSVPVMFLDGSLPSHAIPFHPLLICNQIMVSNDGFHLI